MQIYDNLTKHPLLCSHYVESTSKNLKMLHQQQIVFELIIMTKELQ